MHNAFIEGYKAFETTVSIFVKRCLWLILLLILAMLTLPSVCLAASPITIGGSLGLTGRFAPITDALNKGFTLWQRDVNDRGGILGRPVRVIIEDDRGDSDRAQRIYHELIKKKRVDFLFGPYSSIITETVLPIAEKNGTPMLIAGAAADRLWEQGYRNAIGVYTPASKFTVGFLELLVRRGLDNIAVVYADDPFSIELAESTKKWARRFALTIDHLEMFAKGLPDLAPLALRARDKGSRVLVVCGHMNEAVNMAHALKRIQWHPKAFYASVGPALQTFYDRCGPEAEHVYATSLWESRANYPGAQEFNRKFIETHAATPGYHAGLAYAAGQVLEKAIVETGSIERGKVRDTLYHLDTMTIIGRFGVDKMGKQVRQHTFIIQWQNGRKELVWPDQIQTAEPIFE